MNPKAHLRNDFYRDCYRKITLLSILLFTIILAQSTLIVYLHFTKERSSIFATTRENKLLRWLPLDEKNVSEVELLGWVNDAVLRSYTFNFVNWRDSLTEARRYYTPNGYQHLIKSLKDSGILDDVLERKLVVNATPTGAPVILREGVLNRNYTWQIQIPIRLNYRGIREAGRQEIKITLSVTRLSNLESENGLGINQLLVADSGAGRVIQKNEQMPKY